MPDGACVLACRFGNTVVNAVSVVASDVWAPEPSARRLLAADDTASGTPTDAAVEAQVALLHQAMAHQKKVNRVEGRQEQARGHAAISQDRDARVGAAARVHALRVIARDIAAKAAAAAPGIKDAEGEDQDMQHPTQLGAAGVAAASGEAPLTPTWGSRGRPEPGHNSPGQGANSGHTASAGGGAHPTHADTHTPHTLSQHASWWWGQRQVVRRRAQESAEPNWVMIEGTLGGYWSREGADAGFKALHQAVMSGTFLVSVVLG